MTTSAMTSVRKKWKSRPAWIRFTWNETRRTMGSSRTARKRPSEDPCHTGAHVSHRKTFGRSAIGTVWRRAGRRDKGVPGAARIGLAVGTMPGWPCCATP